jgi:hypothetical protein
MARLKTFAKAPGVVLASDINNIEDDYEYAYSIWRDLGDPRGVQFSPADSGTRVLQKGGGSTFVAGTSVGVSTFADYLTAATDLAVGSPNVRTAKMRMRVSLVVNAVAPAITFTFGYYPVSAIGGASGQLPFVSTLGTVVSGSTIAFASPAANSQTNSISSEFTVPAAGYYVAAVVLSGTVPSNSFITAVITRQVRQT